LLLFAVPILARAEEREMLVTAYCKCGECNGYTRGSWKFLKLDQWNRYVSEGSDRGQRYTGKTASGGRLVQANPGLISTDTAEHPSRIFGRLLPWNWFSRAGTIAADTRYYPFGTRMYIPEYGWGVVGDRGGAIKGPDHIDILFNHHAQTERWGNPHLMVKIVR
jgi:hypothetical protein